MSKRLFDSNLIGRTSEVKILKSSLLSAEKSSVLIRIYGDSGCGKTFFVKKTVGTVISQQDVYACYVDIDSDEMTSTSLFEILTYFSWNAHSWDGERILSVPEKMSYYEFIKKRRVNKQAQNNIISTLQNSLSFIPVYGDVIKNLAKDLTNTENINADFSSRQVEDLFFSYIKKIASKRRIILILDNYQFVDARLRKRIEARFGEIKKNVSLIVIERTVYGKERIRNFLCYTACQIHIHVQKFSLCQTKEYVKNTLSEYSDELVEHFYRITNGNPKELEFAVLNFKQNHDLKSYNFNSKSLIETIHMLPDIEKYVIILTSLFPSGMKLNYVTDIIKQHLIVGSENGILVNINTLKLLGYIIMNSSSGDLIKPAHEKIILSTKSLINNEEYLEIYNNLLLSIEEIIASNEINRNELYLLNGLIGLFTANQLRTKLSCVIKAITINYQQCLYNYINLLYPDIKEVIPILPEDCVIKMLDSFQKTSNFYDGLEMISLLRNAEGMTVRYKLFYAKFLTQTYQFEDALSVLNELDESDAVILCKMNVHQHLTNDAEVRRLLSVLLQNNEDKTMFSDEYYVILRNTAHYFSYDKAVYNLIQVNEYFKHKGFLFGEATVLNNLGVVYLWAGDLDLAKRVLTKANTIFENIGSNEVFESQINLGVLAYLEADYASAIKHIENAEASVPTSLWMDDVIIKVNKALFQIAEGSKSPSDAFDDLYSLCQRVNICKDPWVRFQVYYNTSAAAKLASAQPPEMPNNNIEVMLKSKEYTRFDIATSLGTGETKVDISLSLSPNWRY